VATLERHARRAQTQALHWKTAILDSGKKKLNTGKVETGNWKAETDTVSRTRSTPGGVGSLLLPPPLLASLALFWLLVPLVLCGGSSKTHLKHVIFLGCSDDFRPCCLIMFGYVTWRCAIIVFDNVDCFLNMSDSIVDDVWSHVYLYVDYVGNLRNTREENWSVRGVLLKHCCCFPIHSEM
jgi:hypothetical protein